MNTSQSKKVIVRYKLKADRVIENEIFIRVVFRQLHDRHLEGIRYAVYRLADGFSFVHILSYDSDSAHKEFVSLPAFRNFLAQVGDRFEESPIVSEAEEIGFYCPPAGSRADHSSSPALQDKDSGL